MDTYELQVYQNGGWQFDSYYDSKNIVLSEAERIDATGRYLGVRVLEEKFDEERQKSSYSTIFSRLKKDAQIGSPQPQAIRADSGVSGGKAKGSGHRPAPGRRSKKNLRGGGTAAYCTCQFSASALSIISLMVRSHCENAALEASVDIS